LAENKVGRPLKFKTVEEFQAKIDNYFDSCYENREVKDESGKVVGYERIQVEPYTITGLALALDTTRDLLCDYEDKPQYSDAIKKAKARVENFAEKQVFTSRNPAGAIFVLKNHGWRDKQEVEVTGLDFRVGLIDSSKDE
jgi:hypothetical protein